jgi:cell division protein FtsQ
MARKASPTILQEELYPSSAAVSREDLDDARLVDLDVDEESPFLRGQKRIPARRSTLPKKTANGLMWAAVSAATLCVIGLAAAWLYRYGERSWRFRVQSSDNIEVIGMHNVTKAQIMEVMGADIGRNIFFIPLAQQKALLEQIPWVESASVMRFVPDRLKVEVQERTPVAFARVGPRIALIDAGGTLMELPPKHKYSFPVILGMNPGEPLSTRAPRMKAYDALVQDLDSGGSRYSQDLSEVDLSDLEDVKVRVNDPAGDVLVHLGSANYLLRYKIYVTHVREWRQQFQKLESVDLRYDNQIVVNPDMQGAARHVALSPAAARAAMSAGVKPAALVTRMGRANLTQGNKPVPKPAFELPESKLNPKAPTAATKSGTKARVKRTSSKGRKASAAGKHAAQPRGKAATSVNRKIVPATASRAGTLPKPGVSKPSSGQSGLAALPSSAAPKPSPAIGKQQASQSPN